MGWGSRSARVCRHCGQPANCKVLQITPSACDPASTAATSIRECSRRRCHSSQRPLHPHPWPRCPLLRRCPYHRVIQEEAIVFAEAGAEEARQCLRHCAAKNKSLSSSSKDKKRKGKGPSDAAPIAEAPVAKNPKSSGATATTAAHLQYAWSPDPEHLCVFCSWRHDVVVWVVDPKVHAVPATGRQWPDATIGRQEQTTLGWEGGAEHNRPRWGGQAASANKASVVHPTIPPHRLSHYHSIVRPHPLPHPARCVVSSPWNKIYYNIARK